MSLFQKNPDRPCWRFRSRALAPLRHLDEVADFWEHTSGKKSDVVADDDTFLIPQDLFKALANLDPDELGIYGLCREFVGPRLQLQ
jgi:hypothetical protein